jgi:lipoate-protein ligase A
MTRSYHQKSGLLTPSTVEMLQYLAPRASKYRGRMAPDHPTTVTTLAYADYLRELIQRGVSIQEIADAIPSTYQTVKRRSEFRL